MLIKWFGQSCIQIKAQDKILVIDPFSNKIGLKMPTLRSDIVLITHYHSDHNNLSAIKSREGKKDFKIFNGAGEFEAEGILIKGIPAWHNSQFGKKSGRVYIYLISTEGISLAHLGDLGQKKLLDEQISSLNNVDILFVPVGGGTTIGPEEAFEITNQIDPKIVIPIHYKVKGLKLNLDKVDKFLELEGKSPEPLDEFKIERDKLPKEEREVVVLKP